VILLEKALEHRKSGRPLDRGGDVAVRHAGPGYFDARDAK
jgi:hypothetical protein